MLKYMILSLVIIFLIFSCSNENKNISPQQDEFAQLEKISPHPDHSSPEQLVKSFWKYRIWSDTVFKFDTSTVLTKFYSNDFFDKESSLIKKRINEYKEKGHYLLQSVIDKIETQSDSRVILFAKELGYAADENFENYKYVIVKENNKWFIEDYLRSCWSCDGTGKDKYTSRSDCEYCKGLGWTSMIFN